MSVILEKELSYKLVGCLYEVANKYGLGLKEIIYHKALEEELKKKNLKYESEKRIKIYSLESGSTLAHQRLIFVDLYIPIIESHLLSS